MFTTPTSEDGSFSYASGSPSSPPVRLFGFFCTSTTPACANASVTIAKAIPLTRRLTEPTTIGSTSPTASVTRTACQSSQRSSAIAIT